MANLLASLRKLRTLLAAGNIFLTFAMLSASSSIQTLVRSSRTMPHSDIELADLLGKHGTSATGTVKTLKLGLVYPQGRKARLSLSQLMTLGCWTDCMKSD
ncbi:uncharacterized protein BO66DRAFT_392334 [Aspergillus aculeatinus CBS 121060]|uniref:Uncharacterized protein n=1 Tax=Aspergillus aculeatinus CBS 121060 TaxID=1448322 RepID=A0ACD1H7P8_9EURO|nr:hypothetical protein BO66DRAFT_392334 [Aspergillus aculeatinus CBS 121060]RAH69663.1 hypothetical protein BO66DRAFT_392334 [Aspergillus aculeatinus CBS 121060]